MTRPQVVQKTRAPQQSGEFSRVSISEGVLRAAEEARFLSLEAAHLDASIGAALRQVSLADANRLQNADMIRQGLEGLAQYLAALVDTIDERGTCCPTQAAAALLMADQSQRLLNEDPVEEFVTTQNCSEFWGD